MDQDAKRNSENKSNSTMVWFALIIAITIVVSMFLIMNQSKKTIHFSDFATLMGETEYVEQHSTELVEGKSGKIIVKRNAPTKKRIEYSNPRNLIIGDREISGRIDYRELPFDPKEESGADKEATAVQFNVKKSPTDTQTAELEKLLNKSNIDFRYEGGPTFFESYGFLLITMGLILLLFFMMMKRLGGAGGPMQFGRSRGKLYAEEDLGVSFNDVAGIDEAVEEVKELVDFLQNPEKYQKLGGRIPRGVLLVGPPGTGKTLLAKAIAGEAGVPFFSLSGSDFVEMFVGVGAARVRDMFQQAESKSPCIIFIDELDALGKTRGGSAIGGHDEREQTLNALLVEMDGFASNSGVIVMGATNRPETLDCLLYTSPSPRDATLSRMPSSA